MKNKILQTDFPKFWKRFLLSALLLILGVYVPLIGAALLGGLEWMRHAAERRAAPINPAEAGHTDQ